MVTVKGKQWKNCSVKANRIAWQMQKQSKAKQNHKREKKRREAKNIYKTTLTVTISAVYSLSRHHHGYNSEMCAQFHV